MIEKKGQTPAGVSHAVITLDAQGIRRRFTMTGEDGSFRFDDLPEGKVFITASLLGYQPFADSISLDEGVNMVIVELKEKYDSLAAVSVVAYANLVRHAGDTTIYNTRLLRTEAGAMARDLLEQLPGVEVIGNSIYISGERIQRTYVNGIMVFGDAPLTAFGNIKAEDVKDMRTYDEQSALDAYKGLKHSRKERVLSISTKRPLINSASFVVTAGAGTDHDKNQNGDVQWRYLTAANANFFSERFVLNANLYADNVGDGENNWTGWSTSQNAPATKINSLKPLSTYREFSSFSLNTFRYWGNRLFGNMANLSYSVRKDYTHSSSFSLTNYFADGTSPDMSYDDTSSIKSQGYIHDITVGVALNKSPIKSVSVINSLRFEDKSSSSRYIDVKSVEGAVSSRRDEIGSSKLKDWSWAGNVSWQDNDLSSFTPKIAGEVQIGRNSGSGWTVDTLASSFNRRYLQSSSSTNSDKYVVSAGVDYVLKNDKRATVILGGDYQFGSSRNTRKQTSVELFGPEAPYIDAANTWDYTWNYLFHLAKGSLSYNNKAVSIYTALSVSGDRQQDDERYPSSYRSKQSYVSILPEISLRAFSSKLKIDLRSQKLLPSLEQTRSRINDLNPLVLLGGNPDLKKSISYEGNIAWYSPIQKKGRAYDLAANVVLTTNPIVSRITYFESDSLLASWQSYPAKAGSRLITYDNASLGWKAGISGNYHSRIRPLSALLDVSAIYSFAQTPQYNNGVLVLQKDHSAGGSIKILKRANINYSINLSGFFIHSLSGNTVNNLIRSSCNFYLGREFRNGLQIRTRYNMDDYKYMTGNKKNHLTQSLNLEFGKWFLNKDLYVSLLCIDALNSTSPYSMQMSATSMVESRLPNYGRYYMVNVSWRFFRKNLAVKDK